MMGPVSRLFLCLVIYNAVGLYGTDTAWMAIAHFVLLLASTATFCAMASRLS